jgi:D-sedoheptulose 7-phosphate isomerase
MLDVIRGDINASISVKKDVLANEALLSQIAQLADACLSALRSGAKVIFAGNGGSSLPMLNICRQSLRLASCLTVRHSRRLL